MKKQVSFLVGLMACLGLVVSTAQAQSYSVKDLGLVKGMDRSEAGALNNQEHVAGTAWSGTHSCAFHYYKEFMEDAGGVDSRGFGINSSNIVVGDTYFNNFSALALSHAALFKGGVAHDLGVLKGHLFSRANSINAQGQIVGYSGTVRDGELSRAFIWTGETGMIDIGTLGGPYAQAMAINDAGFITGTASVQDMSAILRTHAFIYQPLSSSERYSEPMRDLGTLGGLSSYGTAINASNHVAGYSQFSPSDNNVHAFLYNGKKMIDLGNVNKALPTDTTVALGLNNSDQVVGFRYFVGRDRTQQGAFVWMPNAKGVPQMFDLNKLIGAAAKNYWLLSATAINDAGQIVVSALDIYNGSAHALLLTPLAPALEE